MIVGLFLEPGTAIYTWFFPKQFLFSCVFSFFLFPPVYSKELLFANGLPECNVPIQEGLFIGILFVWDTICKWLMQVAGYSWVLVSRMLSVKEGLVC